LKPDKSNLNVMAGHLKAQGRISLADAFAAPLAEREQAILVTSNHHEFDPLLAAGSLPVDVRFIRQAQTNK
jgi:predicted nucleic acid-binding protein